MSMCMGRIVRFSPLTTLLLLSLNRQWQNRLLEFPENGKCAHNQQAIVAVIAKATHQRYHLFGHIKGWHNGRYRYDM